MAGQPNIVAAMQQALVNTPPTSLGGTPMTPVRLAAHRTNRNALLTMLQAIVPQQQLNVNVPNPNPNALQAVPVAPAPPRPRCGGLLQLGNVLVPWVGGGPMFSASEINQPVSTLAYRANDLSTALKVEKACSEGLPVGRHLPAPGLTDIATATGSVTFAEWLYMIRMALIERGLDSVFRATVNNQEVFLLEKWGQATKEVIQDQIAFLDANGDEYDRKNLTLSAKFILKSLTIDMLRRTESKIGNGLDRPANGLEVFSAVIALHSVLNDSTERLYVSQLQKLKLVNEPGQNVMTFTDTVLGLARHINGISSNTNDLHVLIYSTMTGSTNEVFKTTVANLLSACSNPNDAAARIAESRRSRKLGSTHRKERGP
jgi:hypothetical protein